MVRKRLLLKREAEDRPGDSSWQTSWIYILSALHDHQPVWQRRRSMVRHRFRKLFADVPWCPPNTTKNNSFQLSFTWEIYWFYGGPVSDTHMEKEGWLGRIVKFEHILNLPFLILIRRHSINKPRRQDIETVATFGNATDIKPGKFYAHQLWQSPTQKKMQNTFGDFEVWRGCYRPLRHRFV